MFKKICVLLMFLLPVGIFAEEVFTAIVKGGPAGFRIGAKYHILKYRANMRAEPSLNGKVIAILSLNDEIEMGDEYFETPEVINGTHGFWLKVKYGNLVGYTFSGNIAMGSFVADIDNNGIMDYFYFRKSRFEEDRFFGAGYYFDENNINNDIFIYINNRRINTNKVNTWVSPLDAIEFEKSDNGVLMTLIEYSKCGDALSEYNIRNDGVIEFLGMNYW
jgi:hypothetical protein